MKKEVVMSIHHRKARCHKGTNESRNLSTVPLLKHQAFNTLFTDPKTGQQMTTEQIVNELNSVWIDPDYFLQLLVKPSHLRKE